MEIKIHVGNHQVEQHMHLWNSQKEKKEKRIGKIFEEIMTDNFENLIKNMTINIPKGK